MKYIFLLGFLLLFHYTSSQDIKQTDGLYYINGDLFSGTFTQTDDEGNTTARLRIRNGRPHGKSDFYHGNGSVKEIRSYRNGLKHGTWEKFNKEGLIISTARYRNDHKHGTWQIWDDNGTLRYSLKYNRGEKTGTWKMWDEKGVLISSKTY